jgi:hypothetical protein
MDDYRYRARRILVGYSPGFAMLVFVALGSIWYPPATEWDIFQAATFTAFALFVAFFPGAVSRMPLLAGNMLGRRKRLFVASLIILAAVLISFVFPETNVYCFIPAILNGTALALVWMPYDDDDLRRRARDGADAKIREIVERVQAEWGPGAVPVPSAA